MASFSLSTHDLAQHGPRVDVRISLSRSHANRLGSSGHQVPDSVEVSALVDTGASMSVLSRRVVKALGISAVSDMLVHSVTTTRPVRAPLYVVRLTMDSGIEFDELSVAAAELSSGTHDVIIGRDVLKHGVFIYVGSSDQFTLAF